MVLHGQEAQSFWECITVPGTGQQATQTQWLTMSVFTHQRKPPSRHLTHNHLSRKDRSPSRYLETCGPLRDTVGWYHMQSTHAQALCGYHGSQGRKVSFTECVQQFEVKAGADNPDLLQRLFCVVCSLPLPRQHIHHYVE